MLLTKFGTSVAEMADDDVFSVGLALVSVESWQVNITII